MQIIPIYRHSTRVFGIGSKENVFSIPRTPITSSIKKMGVQERA